MDANSGQHKGSAHARPPRRDPVSTPESKNTSFEDELRAAEKALDRLETQEDIETIFRREGKPLEITGNRPVLLTDSRSVWLVTKGHVDLFFVQTDQGDQIGIRRHLLRLGSGHLFMGIDSAKHERHLALLAVGTMGNSVLQLDLIRLQTLVKDQEFSAIGLGSLIDQWTAALLVSFKTDVVPKDCHEFSLSGEQHSVREGNYKLSRGIGWIRHLDGTSTLMGIDHLPALSEAQWFPVYEKIWFHTTHATIDDLTTLDFIGQDAFWNALDHFHQYVLEALEITAHRNTVAERIRLVRKAEDEKLSLNNALRKLIAVIRPEKEFRHETTGDPLLAACRAIGEPLKIHFGPPPEASHAQASLEEIARASRVRMRQVMLKGVWWKQDNGPLLGYVEEDKRPVALLPRKPGTYTLFDPGTGTRKPVTAKLADTLDGIAYTFYAPLSAQAVSWKDLCKFGFHGLGNDLATVFLMGIFGMLLGLLTPYTTGLIFDTIIPAAATNRLIQIGVILGVCAIATTLFEITKAIATLRIEGRSDATLQAALWDRLLSLPTSFFRQYTAGDLAIRSMGINAIRQILAGVTIQTLLAGIFSLGYWLLLFYYDWYLALIATAIALFTVLVTLGLGYVYIRYEKPINDIEGKISGLVLQLITGISKLRVTGTEDRAFAVWAKEFSAQRTLSLKSRRIQNIQATFNAVIPIVASMIFFYVVLSKILDPKADALSTGKLLAFLSAAGTFQNTLLEMGMALMSTFSIIPYYQRLKPILIELPEVDTTRSHPGQLTGALEVTQIHFRYNPDGPIILDNVSLNISSGDFIALVGGSGSGKSTLMRLLLGFERPESGTIYYDGQDLSKIDLLEVRRQIGVVLQNSQIMAGSIYQNIVGAGSAHLTIEDAWEAARMAGCEDDIRAMPMGMHTMLPPGGGSLSGGQRQRIIIARAIVRKPRILFFDEATSALDNRTQAIVSESIEHLQATRIVIAHRVSTIINADRIYVMDKGRLVERGTYQGLMAQGGLFAELAKRQLA